jgi:hypothetical protein
MWVQKNLQYGLFGSAPTNAARSIMETWKEIAANPLAMIGLPALVLIMERCFAETSPESARSCAIDLYRNIDNCVYRGRDRVIASELASALELDIAIDIGVFRALARSLDNDLDYPPDAKQDLEVVRAFATALEPGLDLSADKHRMAAVIQRLTSSPTLTILKARRFFLLKSAIEQLMRANGERKNDVLGRKRFWADILLVALSSTEADAQAATFWKRPFVTDPMIREYWHYLHQYYRLSALRLEGKLPPFECIWLARERA